jgi:hypothetical protein
LAVKVLIATAPAGACVALLIHGYHVRQQVYTAEDRDFLDNDRWGYSGGLPSAGRRLKAEMEAIPDPDTALRLHPDWAVIRCDNGEWLFGYGLDSHSFFRREKGTLVTKDSHGRVRIYFGHVCGENGPLVWGASRTFPNLTVFYNDYFAGTMVREWVPDP